MKLNIKKVKAYIISPGTDQYANRLSTVFTRLVGVGFERIEFFKSIPCEQKYRSLSKTLIEIFKRELHNSDPFIIFEDDITIFHDYSEIEIPDNFDVLYLGVSCYAYPHHIGTLTLPNRPHIVKHSTQTCEPINDQLVRVKGMTSGHAVMFRNREYLQYFINNVDRLFDICNSSFSHDLLFSSMISLGFNAYALKNPMFYQDASIGGQEEPTKVRFNGVSFINF